MAREPRADRIHTAPSGASDIGLYGAAPAAFAAPALAMTLAGAPAEAAATPASAVDGGPSAPMGHSLLGDGGSPMTAALMAPVLLMEAANAAIATLSVPRPDAPDTGGESEVAKPAEAHVGSGTPTGILTPNPVSPTEGAERMVVEDAGDDAAIAPAAGFAPSAELEGLVQSAVAGAQAAMTGIGESVAAIETDLNERIVEVDGLVEDQVAAVHDQIAAVTETIDSLEIDLGPIGGIDPAGGVATLVGMVSAADVLGLPDIGGADAIALPDLDLGSSDLLGEFAPGDILLTVPDHHDGALGLLAGLTDDHFG